MNKDKLKIVITVAVLLLIGLAFYLFGYKKPKAIEEQVETPKGQTTEEGVAPVVSPQTNTKSDNQVLFDKKMKEASGYFVKADYSSAITAYNQALTITKSEHAYVGLFSTYSAQKDYLNAEKAILSAIKINPNGSDYWSWYLVLLQDAMKAPRTKLDSVYTDAYSKISANKKINIVTAYARILENLGDKASAIKEWQKAITLNPSMQSVYQAEIDALNK